VFQGQKEIVLAAISMEFGRPNALVRPEILAHHEHGKRPLPIYQIAAGIDLRAAIRMILVGSQRIAQVVGLRGRIGQDTGVATADVGQLESMFTHISFPPV
jgi:hypothetical protein